VTVESDTVEVILGISLQFVSKMNSD